MFIFNCMHKDCFQVIFLNFCPRDLALNKAQTYKKKKKTNKELTEKNHNMESITKQFILSIEIIKILTCGHFWMNSTTGVGSPMLLSHKVGLPGAEMTYC